MLCRFRRVWVAGLLLAAVPLAAAAQVGFGFGFRYRNAKYDGRVALVRARYQEYPGWSDDYPTMENNLAQVLHDITTLRPNLRQRTSSTSTISSSSGIRSCTCLNLATGCPPRPRPRGSARTCGRAGS